MTALYVTAALVWAAVQLVQYFSDVEPRHVWAYVIFSIPMLAIRAALATAAMRGIAVIGEFMLGAAP